MQLCFPGCSAFHKPVTVTMNIKDQVKRKKEGGWLWKVGLWDFSSRQWRVLCDGAKTALNVERGLHIAEVVVPAELLNTCMDPQSKCMLFSPVTNYKGCPGRPYVGLTSGEAAAMAGCSVFGLMLLLQLCACAHL
jgi:hypothetical protein